MPNPINLTERIIELLEKNFEQTVRKLAKELKINRTYFADHLEVLENHDRVMKRTEPTKIYLKKEGV